MSAEKSIQSFGAVRFDVAGVGDRFLRGALARDTLASIDAKLAQPTEYEKRDEDVCTHEYSGHDCECPICGEWLGSAAKAKNTKLTQEGEDEG